MQRTVSLCGTRSHGGEISVDFLPLWKGKFITNSVLGKLNSVNPRSQELTHISFSLCWRREMGKNMVVLKTAPVAAVPRAAKKELHEVKKLLASVTKSLHEMLREK